MDGLAYYELEEELVGFDISEPQYEGDEEALAADATSRPQPPADDNKPVQIEGSNRFAGLKRQQNLDALALAYDNFRRGGGNSQDLLWDAMITYARRLMMRLEHDFADFGTSETADDFAQAVVLKCKRNIMGQAGYKPFVGNGGNFAAWFRDAVLNAKKVAAKKILKQKAKKVPLFVTAEDEDGEMQEIENPAIHRHSEIIEHGVQIPDSVVGLDRAICLLILEGRLNYKEIGEALKPRMTEEGVKKRLQRLKATLDGTGERKARAERQAARDAEWQQAAGRRGGAK